MDTAQWPQEIVVKPIEEILVTNSSSTCPKPPPAGAERKAATRPQKDQLALNCPRCNSTNTKFCYYNNYSLTQPRYFCKTCRRYWTEGGSLRNIPVGGGSRKNKRSSSSSTTTTSSSISASSSAQAAARNNNINKLPDLVNPHHHHQNPKIHHHEDHQGQDLNLAFPTGQQGFRSNISEFVQAPNIENNKNSSNHISSLELLTGMSSRGLNSFMPMPPVHHHHHHHHNPDPTSNNNTVNYTPGLFPSMQDFKPTLGFSLDGLGSGYGSLQETTNGRLLFPFEDLKQVSSTTQHDIHDHQQNRDQQHNGDSSGYWTGMLGGGSW